MQLFSQPLPVALHHHNDDDDNDDINDNDENNKKNDNNDNNGNNDIIDNSDKNENNNNNTLHGGPDGWDYRNFTVVAHTEDSITFSIVDPDGKVIQRSEPHTWKEPMTPQTAAELTAMMTAVVQGGTGVAAQIPGVQVAGKTGTAETGRTGENDTWFIAFAPAENPQVAVAVALSNQSGTGGATAAPIAKEIMEALLR